MRKSALSLDERTAISKAMAYWLEHWDWEMPMLTGLTVDEFRAAAEAWRGFPEDVSESLALAALGAVRECWSQVRNASEVLGLTPEETEALLKSLAKEIDNAV